MMENQKTKIYYLILGISRFKSYYYLFKLNWFSSLDFKVDFCFDFINELATINRTVLLLKNNPYNKGFQESTHYCLRNKLREIDLNLYFPHVGHSLYT